MRNNIRVFIAMPIHRYFYAYVDRTMKRYSMRDVQDKINANWNELTVTFATSIDDEVNVVIAPDNWDATVDYEPLWSLCLEELYLSNRLLYVPIIQFSEIIHYNDKNWKKLRVPYNAEYQYTYRNISAEPISREILQTKIHRPYGYISSGQPGIALSNGKLSKLLKL